MLSKAGFSCFVEVLNDNLWEKAAEYQIKSSDGNLPFKLFYRINRGSSLADVFGDFPAPRSPLTRADGSSFVDIDAIF